MILSYKMTSSDCNYRRKNDVTVTPCVPNNKQARIDRLNHNKRHVGQIILNIMIAYRNGLGLSVDEMSGADFRRICQPRTEAVRGNAQSLRRFHVVSTPSRKEIAPFYVQLIG